MSAEPIPHYPEETPEEAASTDTPDAPVIAPEAPVIQAESGAPAPGDPAGAPEDKIIPYDFRHPSLLTPSEQRKLRHRHEEFARSLATRMSIQLRMEFGLQLQTLETLPFRQFMDELPNPNHFTIFKIEPMIGAGLLELPPDLAWAIVDRLLGGPGKPISLERDPTEIEIALLDQTVQVVLKEWCQHVCRQPDARTMVLGHENNGRFLQLTSNDTPMVVMTLSAHLGDVNAAVHLAFPYEMIEPLIQQISPAVPVIKSQSGSDASAAPGWNPLLGSVRVPLMAHWTGLNIAARRLTELKVGDVLNVEVRHGSQVQVRVSTVPKFVGRLGTRGKTWAVELTRPVMPE